MPPKRADPSTPKEALAWFKKRVPITKVEWFKLTQRAQEKTFTIAGIAQLDLIAKTQRALLKAIKDGETLRDFKKRVGKQLEDEWGEKRAWHLELIFRNALQRAYQAGRREALMKPGTLAIRPYLKAEPILDARTSEYCRPLFGVVLPADHPFWNTHWPPLHHGCRTSIRSLTAAQAKMEGISKRAPRVKPDEGFGGVDPLEWKPDLSAYPPVLVKTFRKRR